MKILKVEELNENFEKNIHEKSDKIQKFKNTLEDFWTEGFGAGADDEAGNRQSYFSDYWDENADRLIQEFGLLEKDEPRGNIREILPQMAQKSNNSQITQQTAQRIADKFTKAELNDFKRWLQLIR